MSRNNLLLIVGVIVVAAVIIFNLDMEVELVAAQGLHDGEPRTAE